MTPEQVEQWKKERDIAVSTGNEEAIKAVARQAIARKTGARGLRSIMESTMTEIMYEIPSREDVKKCVLTKETIERKSKPKLLLESGNELKDQEATAS